MRLRRCSRKTESKLHPSSLFSSSVLPSCPFSLISHLSSLIFSLFSSLFLSSSLLSPTLLRLRLPLLSFFVSLLSLRFFLLRSCPPLQTSASCLSASCFFFSSLLLFNSLLSSLLLSFSFPLSLGLALSSDFGLWTYAG